jgi:polysaccharide biosynthesis/export protein
MTTRFRHSVAPAISWILVLAVLALGGCASRGEAARTSYEMNMEPLPPLTLTPGDVIDIKFLQAPELDALLVPILPDGTIYVQLIGQVKAAGKTPAGLRDELVHAYAAHLRTPELMVIPRTIQASRVWVGGEVTKPGMLLMNGPTTALQAIVEAGGFNLDTADVSSVVVIRNRDGRPYGCKLDLRDMLEGKEAEPFLLHQQDIVYVPRTSIANVGLWIDQHINKIIPNIGVQYIYRGDNYTVGYQSRY